MTIQQKRPHLACYDISDPRRLSRVHRYLKKAGIPLQYSVFLLYINALERDKIHHALDRLIDPRADDVRIYPLPQNPDWQLWGQPLWPEGLHLSEFPLPSQLDMLR